MYKLAIFDLDMCILDTRTLGQDVIEPVLDILRASDIDKTKQKEIEDSMWTTSFADVVERFELPKDLADEMSTAYANLEVPDDIKTFGDERCLEKIPMKKVLVTSGYRKFQQNKIDQLGIAGLFDDIEIEINDVPEERKGKKKIFVEFIQKYNVEPEEVLIVGDSAHSELKAGKELGMVTVQTLRPTVKRWEGADYHIDSLCELESIHQTGSNVS